MLRLHDRPLKTNRKFLFRVLTLLLVFAVVLPLCFNLFNLWGSSSYSESSLLLVEIHYVPLETEAAFPVYWIVIICVAGAGIIAAGIFIIIKSIRRKMNERSI
ncbi:MAG: hypothetical protein LBE09_07435 [Christensenellaceae bacterium]|jgi:hypothetical protein|nr:hypothetical protein [Christensenellaceae bacterium]